MKSPRRLAGVCAGGTLLLCLCVEYGLLAAHPEPMTLIPGLLDLRYSWNHGVSFSLLWQDSATGNLVLSGALLAMTLFLAVLAWRSQNRLSASGFGLIIGGAIANLMDRQIHGAVFDFLSLHLGTLPLFICNLPDIAISLGVILLLWESMLTPGSSSAPSRQ